MKQLKHLARIVFSQKATIILLLAAQISFILFTFLRLSAQYTYLNIIFTVIALALTIYILNKPENPDYKLVWIIPLLAMPLFATIAYLILVNQYNTKKLRKEHYKKRIATNPFLKQSEEVLNNLNIQNKGIYRLSR